MTRGTRGTRASGWVLLVASGVLVLYAEGLHWIALWNLLPLLAAGATLVFAAPGGGNCWATFTFSCVTALAIAIVHLAWVFDWGGTRTASSTAGLVFLVSPILSLLLGGSAWTMAWIVERWRKRSPAALSQRDRRP